MCKSRRCKPIDELVLLETVARDEAHDLDAEETAMRLGVSASTFFRRLREIRSRS